VLENEPFLCQELPAELWEENSAQPCDGKSRLVGGNTKSLSKGDGNVELDLLTDTSVMPIVTFRFPSSHFTDCRVKANYFCEKF